MKKIVFAIMCAMCIALPPTTKAELRIVSFGPKLENPELLQLKWVHDGRGDYEIQYHCFHPGKYPKGIWKHLVFASTSSDGGTVSFNPDYFTRKHLCNVWFRVVDRRGHPRPERKKKNG